MVIIQLTIAISCQKADNSWMKKYSILILTTKLLADVVLSLTEIVLVDSLRDYRHRNLVFLSFPLTFSFFHVFSAKRECHVTILILRAFVCPWNVCSFGKKNRILSIWKVNGCISLNDNLFELLLYVFVSVDIFIIYLFNYLAYRVYVYSLAYWLFYFLLKNRGLNMRSML